MKDKLNKIIEHFNKAENIAKEIAEEYNCIEDKNGSLFYVRTKEDFDKIASLLGGEVKFMPNDIFFNCSIKYRDKIEFSYIEVKLTKEDYINKMKNELNQTFEFFINDEPKQIN